MSVETLIWLVTLLNPIKHEGLYGRFDNLTTQFKISKTSDTAFHTRPYGDLDNASILKWRCEKCDF